MEPQPAQSNLPVTAPAAVPNAFSGNPADVPAATASYDPRTGRYVGSDGQVYAQTDLKQSADPATWTDMLPH